MANEGDETLVLRDTTGDEIEAIAAMEQGDASEFIIASSPEQHREDSSKPDILYKSVLLQDELIGYVILGLDPDGRSLETRRILIARPGRGYGRRVLGLVDDVAAELGRPRLWLDVFEGNARARHVYESCGFRQFGKTELNGRPLLLLEKLLDF